MKRAKKFQKVNMHKSAKRRAETQCKYSIFLTLLMKFLKEKNIYQKSQTLAKRNSISTQKNYSIIVLRMSLYIHYEVYIKNCSKKSAIQNLFSYLYSELDLCIKEKYGHKNKSLYAMARQKSINDLEVFQKAFNVDDLTNQQVLINILVGLYDKGNNRNKTVLHQKYACELSKILSGVYLDGDNFQSSYEFSHSQKSVETLQKAGNQYSNCENHLGSLTEQLYLSSKYQTQHSVNERSYFQECQQKKEEREIVQEQDREHWKQDFFLELESINIQNFYQFRFENEEYEELLKS